MAQINRWDGGLSVRLNPSLININEGVIYSNIDSSEGTLKPFMDDLSISIASAPYIYNFKNTWLYSSEERSYVEFHEKLYYSNGVIVPQKSIDGIVWHNLGIQKPVTAPSTIINGAGVHTGVLQYCYTYYNSIDGSESAPSLYSTALTVTTNKIDITLVASADVQVTNIKLYRLGASLTSMFLVTTLTNEAQTYTDNIADIDIAGFPLDTVNSGQAPNGLNFLTEANAMLFGAIGDRLYFSEIAIVDSWGPFNFLDFAEPITGLGTIQNGLIVFTFNSAYIVVGNSPVTLSKYLVSGNQGCIAHNTIRFINNTLVWVSNDGVCASSGGDVQVITKDKLGILPLGIPTTSIVHNEIYYLGLPTYTLCIDFRQSLIIRKLDMLPTSFHIYLDELYYYASGQLFKVGAGTYYKNILYRSGNIGEGSLTNLKKYSVFYTNSLGNLTIRIYIDGILVTTQRLGVGFTEILIPTENTLGYYMTYEVEGTGQLLELEYKVEGRQNGR